MRRKIITSTLAGAFAAVAIASVALARDPGGMEGDEDGHWFAMIIVIVMAAAAVVALVIALRSRQNGPAAAEFMAPGQAVSPTAGAEALLAERLARGEISPDDYRTTLAVLRGEAGPSAGQ